ncbi:MAG: mannose-1-phosphate guanylyltransferase [Peptococcaceae bacterium]|nr:MAG: mannose-1-phosphate guanylyltransferase [Peptococcaceae bacterium]
MALAKKAKNEPEVIALIMAGGRGERFWPKSRASMPKQFLSLCGDKTMLQQTVGRVEPLVSPDRVFIATSRDYVALVREQLPGIPERNLIAEPLSRDTAACIGLAALHIEKQYPHAVMLVLPADHVLSDVPAYLAKLEKAVSVASSGLNIVTLGIKPDRPETGYGYIQQGELASRDERAEIYRVKAFKEKPSLPKAEEFLAKGGYLWNSGMFVWRVDTIRKLIARYMPMLHMHLEAIRAAIGTEEEDDVLNREFALMRKVSVDYGILEKAKDVYVIPGEFGWDDVGNWLSLKRTRPCDEDGNVVACRHVGIDTKNCIIEGGEKLLVTAGLNDVVIVVTEDVVLVCTKEKAGRLRDIVTVLKEKNLTSYL